MLASWRSKLLVRDACAIQVFDWHHTVIHCLFVLRSFYTFGWLQSLGGEASPVGLPPWGRQRLTLCGPRMLAECGWKTKRPLLAGGCKTVSRLHISETAEVCNHAPGCTFVSTIFFNVRES